MPPIPPRFVMVNVPPRMSSGCNLFCLAQGGVSQLLRQFQHALLVHIAEDRHQQAALGIDGHADMIIAFQHELPRGNIEAGIEVGKLLEGDGGSLEGERRHGGLRTLPFLLFAKGIEVRYVGNILLGNVRHLAPGETH